MVHVLKHKVKGTWYNKVRNYLRQERRHKEKGGMKVDSIVEIFFFVHCWVCSVGIFFNAVLWYLGLTEHPRRFFFVSREEKKPNPNQLSSPSNASSWHLKPTYAPKINSFEILVMFTHLFCFFFQASLLKRLLLCMAWTDVCVVPFSLVVEKAPNKS